MEKDGVAAAPLLLIPMRQDLQNRRVNLAISQGPSQTKIDTWMYLPLEHCFGSPESRIQRRISYQKEARHGINPSEITGGGNRSREVPVPFLISLFLLDRDIAGEKKRNESRLKRRSWWPAREHLGAAMRFPSQLGQAKFVGTRHRIFGPGFAPELG